MSDLEKKEQIIVLSEGAHSPLRVKFKLLNMYTTWSIARKIRYFRAAVEIPWFRDILAQPLAQKATLKLFE